MVSLSRTKKAQSNRPDHSKNKSGGKESFVIVIGDDGAILTQVQGNTVVRRLFAPSSAPEHVRTFVELMNTHPSAPVSILVDMIDQSYVRHSLPPVSPLGVNKLVQRRLDRDFPEDDITGYLHLGREKKGRKDWNFLLISLSATDELNQWLDIVLECPNHFKGIYLVPVECQEYIDQIALNVPRNPDDKDAEWKILISHNKVSGFRQVVTHNGKLVFTRLAQSMSEGIPEVVAGNIEQEVMNTIEFLRRMGYNESAGMEAFAIVGQEIKVELDFSKANMSRQHVFTPAEMSAHLGLHNAALSGDRFGDVVMATSFAKTRKKRLKLSNNLANKLDALTNASKGLRLVAGCLFLGCLYVIGTSLYSYYKLDQDLSDLRSNKMRAEVQLDETKKILQELPDDIDRITGLVSSYETLQKDNYKPLDFVDKMLKVQSNDVLIKEIDWVYQDPVVASFVAPTNTNQTRGRRSAVAQEQPEGPLVVSVNVEFLVDAPTRDAFAAIANQYLEDLRAEFDDFEVAYANLPGDRENQQEIQINFDDTGGAQTFSQDDFNVEITFIGPVEKDEDAKVNG